MSTIFPELFYFLVMLCSFILLSALKVPISIALMLAALGGFISAGEYLPIRHLIEGSFVFLDAMLVIASAMIFMESIKESGFLTHLANTIYRNLKNYRLVLLVLMSFFIMFAGMITGSSTAAVLTTGAIAFPVLKRTGLNKTQAGAIIAMSAIFGMLAPPVNLPVMIIGQGVDMPYIGFYKPLSLMSFPLATITVLLLGRKKKNSAVDDMNSNVPTPDQKGILLYLPVFTLLALMVFDNFLSIGLPLIFILSSLLASLISKKNFIDISKKAISESLNILSILVGVGMFLQAMTFTGVRGFIVNSLSSLPDSWSLIGVAIGVPLFGAVSSFGSASVLGIPFLLTLLGKNDIVVASAISLLAGLGDMVPPTALAGIFAAYVVEEKRYFRIWAASLPSLIITMIAGSLIIVNAASVGKFIESMWFYPVFFGGYALFFLILYILDKRG
ncbi:MAG: gluconate:H+ symporter, GntP family [Thermotogota bacterium]|nr:gluconate:H+ symporter, GntP family [Thermotogota bacterium]MDK2864431.1 gluconate:H+ symporter, GntP family [Thermotogota bacterium]HCZ05539.1 C4-dicarboxylate ABC transporter permease [Thermotogota bacterium]